MKKIKPIDYIKKAEEGMLYTLGESEPIACEVPSITKNEDGYTKVLKKTN